MIHYNLFETNNIKCKAICKNDIVSLVIYERYYINDFMSNFNVIMSQFVTQGEHGKARKGFTPLQKSLNTPYIQRGKKSKSLVELHCGLDIETTKINDNLTFPYGWQFSIKDIVIWGDNFNQLILLFDKLKEEIQYNKCQRLIVWVANLGYEWQFVKHYLNITKAFLKEIREPIEIEHNEFIILKECLSWGGSLKKLASDYTDLIKLKGDLDFSVYRENYREFTKREEWQYIDFDVLTLSHFGRWYFRQYVNANHSKPVTIQSAIRKNLYNNSTEEEREKVKSWTIKDHKMYDILVNWVYRGGYNHARKTIIGEVIEGLLSFDFTSSYPSVMLCEKYPTRFSRVLDRKKWSLERVLSTNLDNTAYILHCEFIGLKSTTAHSIESKSKLLNPVRESDNNTIIDNGRVCECPLANVWITEQDLLTYKEFYTWESVKILDLWTSPKEYLPRYIIDELTKLYIAKDTLKKNHKPYAIEKSYLNSLYGVLISKLVVGEITIDEFNNAVSDLANLTAEEVEQKYKERYKEDIENDKKIVLPQWGCWVSAYARRNLLSTLYKLETTGNMTAYMDTDSIKFLNTNNGVDIIEEYNRKQQNKIKKMCTKYNLDYNIFYDLGSFDCEYKEGIKYFKTLGCKRYLHIYEEEGETHYQCTVAGLPKNDYIDRYKPKTGNPLDFMSPFTDNLTIDKTSKLISSYEDNEQSFEGKTYYKGQLLFVPSCVTLNDCSFSLSLNEQWVLYLQSLSSSIFEQRKL